MSRFEGVKFWDEQVEDAFKDNGVPNVDACLQIRQEVELLSDWMADKKIRSYLEIGVWTGQLISNLEAAFNFEKLAACDLKAASAYGLEVKLPGKTNFFHGNCMSPLFINWRDKLGAVDLVLIDVDHSYETTHRLVELNASMKTKYIALCGISEKHRGINGVLPVWKEVKAEKLEILEPHQEINLEYSTIGIGVLRVK